MTPYDDLVILDEDDVTVMPFDPDYVSAQLEKGEFAVILAITAEDKIVSFHAPSRPSGLLDEPSVASATDGAERSLPKSESSVRYQRCCFGGRKGVRIRNRCDTTNRAC